MNDKWFKVIRADLAAFKRGRLNAETDQDDVMK